MCTVDSTVQGKRNGSQYLNNTYNLYLAIELPICIIMQLVSPDDIVNACKLFESLVLPLW